MLLGVIGWLLPATREGRAETVIAASPARVLAVIADVESQPDWRAGLASVTRTAVGWIETTGRAEAISFTPVVMSERLIHLRFASDAGYSGEWLADLTTVDGGTRIAVVERVTIPSPFGRLLARAFCDPEDFATTYLSALKARSERQ
ncbi:MAG: hypothetical protein CFE34_18515 [Rhodobacteraceae bacterium PARR1]|nr:MAG: hypothetical protein CFE34_18515 [Rhodobacteraceae bacterium PARR1]